MDNTSLTLVVAGMGAVSALLGAAAGGLAAVKGAKHSGEAMLAQVQQQATAEHSRWLRERRHECSVTLRRLLDQVMQDATVLNVRRRRPGDGSGVEANSTQILRDMFAAGNVLELVGPSALAQAGSRAALAAANLLVEAGKDGYESAEVAFHRAQFQFTKEAREATVIA